LVAAAPASALPEGYHYELVSPPDKNDGDVGAGLFVGAFYASADGDRIAYPATGGFGDTPSNGVATPYMAIRGDEYWSSTSLALPMAPSLFIGSNQALSVSPDFTKAISLATIDVETGRWLPIDAPELRLLDVETRESLQFSVRDIYGNAVAAAALDSATIAGNADYSRVIYEAQAEIGQLDGLGSSDYRVYMRNKSGVHSRVNYLPDGRVVPARLPDVSMRPVSERADVVYFTTRSAGSVSNDDRGLYRRDLTEGTTSLVNADENDDETVPPADVDFVGASADGRYAYFVTSQRLVEEDKDGTQDLYRYDHSKPEGSRLTLVSYAGETGSTPTQVLGYGVSADGETVVFVANGQLVPGEPTTSGYRLYTWRNGQLRHIGVTGAFSNRDRVLSEDGGTFAFVTNTDPIGQNPNGIRQVYVLDVPSGQLSCATCEGGTSSGVPMLLRGPNLTYFTTISYPRRAASTEGHVFFQTQDALLPEDENGKYDVYVWQDGELDLVSTGQSSDDSFFLDASVDGSTAFFMTREQLSNWDRDNRIDIYAIRTGEPLPEPPEPLAPCTGDDCQGPPPLPKPFDVPSSKVDGPGNPDAPSVNCGPAERKAKQAANKAKRLEKKAKRLAKKARKAKGKKAKQLKRQANQTKRKAKQARAQARKAADQLALCREEAEL